MRGCDVLEREHCEVALLQLTVTVGAGKYRGQGWIGVCVRGRESVCV